MKIPEVQQNVIPVDIWVPRIVERPKVDDTVFEVGPDGLVRIVRTVINGMTYFG